MPITAQTSFAILTSTSTTWYTPSTSPQPSLQPPAHRPSWVPQAATARTTPERIYDPKNDEIICLTCGDIVSHAQLEAERTTPRTRNRTALVQHAWIPRQAPIKSPIKLNHFKEQSHVTHHHRRLRLHLQLHLPARPLPPDAGHHGASQLRRIP